MEVTHRCHVWARDFGLLLAKSHPSLPPACPHGLFTGENNLWFARGTQEGRSKLRSSRSLLPSPTLSAHFFLCASLPRSHSRSPANLSEWVTLNITDPATLVAPLVYPDAGYRVINPDNPLLYVGGYSR